MIVWVRALVFILLLVLWSAPARAQHSGEAFLAERTHPHAVRLTVAMDPALQLGLGYLHVVELGARRLGVHADVATILGFSSWDLTAGASVRVFERRGLDLLTTLDARLKVAHNDVHDAVVYGYAAALRPGWFGASWYVALDLAARGALAVTVNHSAGYREMVPDVVDGTYASDHVNLFAGVAFGFDLADRVLVGARFAWRFARTFESYAPYFVPYTVDVDVGVRF